jgi:Tfp pilus assembly protein PilF
MATIADALDAAFRHYESGNMSQGELICWAILQVDPECADALNLLGSIAGAQDQHEQAIDLFRRALAVHPQDPRYHRNLAAACKEAGRLEDALRHYRDSLAFEPSSFSAHVHLAETLTQLGQFDEAIAHNRAALRIEPKSPIAYCNLGEFVAQGLCTFTEEERQRLEDLAGSSQVSPEDASAFHFTLASALDRDGAFDRAFIHYHRGNELKREVYRQTGQAFDASRHRQLVDAIQTVFTPAYFQRVQAMGSDSEIPLFVVGMVRSGTTLVEQILATHPQIHGAGELRTIEQIAATLGMEMGDSQPYPFCASRLAVANVRLLADRYLNELRVGRLDASRAVDKMPHNFMHLGLIATLFPHARVIYCRRDPLDLGTAIYLQNFKWMPQATSFEDIASYMEQAHRLMKYWRRNLPLPIHEVLYEDLVDNLEPAARRLIAFCGLGWDERCLRFHETRRRVQTASKLQVRRPIYRSSVGRWKRYEKQLRPFLDMLRRMA